MLGCIFHFYKSFNRTFCKQTVENLVRRRILRHLIWFCTVCQCTTKRTLGLYGLTRIPTANIEYVNCSCWNIISVSYILSLISGFWALCNLTYFHKVSQLGWVEVCNFLNFNACYKGHLLLILLIHVNCSCWNIISVSYILSPISGFIKSLSLCGGL